VERLRGISRDAAFDANSDLEKRADQVRAWSNGHLGVCGNAKHLNLEKLTIFSGLGGLHAWTDNKPERYRQRAVYKGSDSTLEREFPQWNAIFQSVQNLYAKGQPLEPDISTEDPL
jgi:hypothetical protein